MDAKRAEVKSRGKETAGVNKLVKMSPNLKARSYTRIARPLVGIMSVADERTGRKQIRNL